jgi:hypothetical protein
MGEVVHKDQLPAQDQGAALIQLIQRASTDPQVDLDKMERLFAMHERIVAKQAEAAFNDAMSVAQSEMGRISTDATNSQTKSGYATYGKLDKALRPIYTSHGFALSFGTEDAPTPECVRVVCSVSHRGGHTRHYHIDMPADGKGAKGGEVMTKTHATGAAATYGMRYLLKMIFNVAIGEDDTDGNMPQSTITTEQAAELKALLQETDSDTIAFLKAMGDAPSVDELPANTYNRAKIALNKKKVRLQNG